MNSQHEKSSSFRQFADRLLAGRRAGDHNLVLLDCVDSTNLYARKLVAKGVEPEAALRPTLIVAYEQTAGRGRLGRSWTSLRGLGLYLTWLLPVPGESERASSRDFLGSLPLLSAVGLCRAVDSLGAPGAVIKWPNDVLLDSRKVAGILIEVVTAPQATVEEGESPCQYAVVGLGVNHGHRREQLPTAVSTSLLQELHDNLPVLADALLEVARCVNEELVLAGDLTVASQRYRDRLVHQVGQEITCRTGGRTIRGAFGGVDEQGHLRLETDEGPLWIASGEILEGADSEASAPSKKPRGA